MCVYLCICVHLCAWLHVYIYIQVYIYMHVYTHMCIFIYTWNWSNSLTRLPTWLIWQLFVLCNNIDTPTSSFLRLFQKSFLYYIQTPKYLNSWSIQFFPTVKLLWRIFICVLFRRWLRLLFGREFPMQDLLILWDAIFADSLTFDLVDYVFVAMLSYLKNACQYFRMFSLFYSFLTVIALCFSLLMLYVNIVYLFYRKYI